MGQAIRLKRHAGPTPDCQQQTLVDFRTRGDAAGNRERQQQQSPDSETRHLHPNREKSASHSGKAGSLLQLKRPHEGKAETPKRASEDQEEDGHDGSHLNP